MADKVTGSVQNYQYDDLYRLTQANGQLNRANQSQYRYSLDMQYDAIHNITLKQQSNQHITSDGVETAISATSYNWAYEYNHNQPHAPSHVGDRSFNYDANGNLTRVLIVHAANRFR
ncbi:MAG: hypothetical protein OEY38_17445 [Gammaproteobacteria bacterium]|nr:hypothetical protein [Gammaproteobacteria bacterium]